MPTVTLPRLLEPASPHLVHDLDASSLSETMEKLFERAPGLRVHLIDEAGGLRDHVLCFVDGMATRLEDGEVPVGPGTRIDFIQAVSGGC